MAKVLCVDDSAMTRRLIQVVLGNAGMEVIAASSGQEGLDRLASDRPDAVLLDMHLPDMDGLAWLRSAAASDQTGQPPVIVLTGRDDPEQVEAATALGARAFIVKPFEYEALRDAVRGVLPAS